MSFVVQVRQRARGNVSAAMVVWSLVMTVALVAWEVSPASDATASLWGIAATVIFGAYLGWRRRGAAVFVAPLVNWSFAWLPLMVAAMIRHGFLKGLFVGLVLISLGWLIIGTLEFLVLGAVALVVRSLHGGRPRANDGDVIIFGPDERI